LGLVLFSCVPAGRKKTSGFSSSIEKSHSLETAESIEISHRTLNEFEDALLNPKPGYDCFCLKLPFSIPEGVEYLWAREIWIENGSYYGVIDSTPEVTEEVKHDDTLQIPDTRIIDWMYLNHDTLVGGFTIRSAVKALTPEEKEKFFNEYPMVIE
jgi:uncharacterized protein YegJ (DUF2314 family)